MLNKTINTLGMLAVVGGSLAAGEAHAASVSATTSILGVDGGTLLSFSNDRYETRAWTPFLSRDHGSNTLPNYNFNTTASNGDTSFARIDNSLSPLPQTSAGAVHKGRGDALVRWVFDWAATGTGNATVGLNYLYSETVKNLTPSKSGAEAVSYIDLWRSGGVGDVSDSHHSSTTINGNPSGKGHLLLNFDVKAGDRGVLVVQVESAAQAWDWSSPVPVPVPSAVWLLGSALAGLAGYARRKAA